MDEAVSYLRCSGAGQIDGDTFARQDEVVAKFFAAQGIQYVAAYPEYGITGDSNLEGRAALGALSVALENGSPKIIGIEHPDRMARGMMAGLLILDEMRKLGATVLCACDGRAWTIDPKDPEAVLFWGIRQLFAQYEKSRDNAKMMAGRVRKRMFGTKDDPNDKHAEGELPYGARPGEAEIRDRIMGLHRASRTPHEIAKLLNSEGVLTRKGGRWIRQVVYKIIKRERKRAT